MLFQENATSQLRLCFHQIWQEHLENFVYSYQGVKSLSLALVLSSNWNVSLLRRHHEKFSMQFPFQEHWLDLSIQKIQTEGIKTMYISIDCYGRFSRKGQAMILSHMGNSSFKPAKQTMPLYNSPQSLQPPISHQNILDFFVSTFHQKSGLHLQKFSLLYTTHLHI